LLAESNVPLKAISAWSS